MVSPWFGLMAFIAAVHASRSGSPCAGYGSAVAALSHNPSITSICSKDYPSTTPRSTVTITSTTVTTYTSTTRHCGGSSAPPSRSASASLSRFKRDQTPATATATRGTDLAIASIKLLPPAPLSTFCSCLTAAPVTTTTTTTSTATTITTVIAPCPSGYSCDTSTPGGAVCRPFPESSCSNPIDCAVGPAPCDPTGDCFCTSDAEGRNFCIYPGGCPAFPQACNSNSECAAGELCLTGCCPGAPPMTCVNAIYQCENAFTPSRLFRRRAAAAKPDGKNRWRLDGTLM